LGSSKKVIVFLKKNNSEPLLRPPFIKGEETGGVLLNSQIRYLETSIILLTSPFVPLLNKERESG
jgi:hypothetical protein